jgi:exodeoxyribonuclease VII small subunit
MSDPDERSALSDEEARRAHSADGGGTTTDYETATARLDEIITRLDSGDAQLRETLDLCAEAKTLIEYCAAELAAVDQGLKELRLDDLAASLKSASSASSSEVAETAEPSGAIEETGFDQEPPPPEEPPF